PLDEVGYVVGNVTDDGYLTVRRVGVRIAYPLFDQQLEGQPVTVFGAGGAAVPGVVAVKSTHLTRGRPAASDPVFTADNAYVDVGARSRDDVRALGIAVLAPVALTKRPHRYGDRLLAAPAAGRRAACAALVAAARAKPRVKGTVVVAFTVQSLYATNAGLSTVQALRGPFAETQSVLTTLVETYGVSEAEGPVREAVKRLLPPWVKSETDTAGNLWVRVGQGDPVVVVIAHLDEIGFRVTAIRDDGALELQPRGGFFASLYEAKPALVHTERGPVPGV